MSKDEDQALIEATKIHKERLRGAFLNGRKGVNQGIRTLSSRLIGSIILAAVACGICVGTSFVLSVLPSQPTNNMISSTTSSEL